MKGKGNNMSFFGSFDDFKHDVVDNIRNYLPKEYVSADISISGVMKNNDQKLDGLIIKKDGVNIAPTIYLNDYYKRLQEDNEYDLDNALKSISKLYLDNVVSSDFDMSKILDFNTVRDNISCRIINAEYNERYLSDKPHKTIEDLAVVYYVDLGSDERGSSMSTPITTKLMDSYGVDIDTLHQIAIKNMNTINKPCFMDIMSLIEQLSVHHPTPLPEDLGVGLYVLTNESKMHGAAALLNKDVMDQVSNELGDNFYILPSSIHEVILLKNSNEFDPNYLINMVKDINRREIRPDEKLSDNIYSYDSLNHKISIVNI
jgi:hypothetical protein